MNKQRSGSCGCGAVNFTVTGSVRDVIYCHCSQCRKQTGHFYAATNVADSDISVQGVENVTWYHSSAVARRGFCRVCGSALFWKLDGLDTISVMAGAFDTPSGLKGECHIFVADKGDYYEIDDGLPQFPQSTPAIKVAGD
ncbi:GFA family protein [Pseudaminobacter arsenicus]|uniref:GFA family protein n=1 Tax=Borborobacter arsenicus TaxID=1851146 RepID=A0A432V726_9HYPH|nr:GFA family protein [Pseudaminobacter arsenicus]RUM97984.1 GFA family protein [Pseudaminobacter arsenicus]